MPKLILLDGHSLAYRAFYALPSDLATSQGQVTNAVYGPRPAVLVDASRASVQQRDNPLEALWKAAAVG